MENQNQLNGTVLVGTLRTRLLYKSRDAMQTQWQQVFTDELLPDDHVSVETQKVKIFLESLSKPQRGRSGAITNAAVEFLKNFNLPVELPVVQLPISNSESPLLPGGNQTKLSFWQKPAIWFSQLTALDVVFFANMAVADYGLIFLLKEMGFAWAFIYTLVSFHALKMAKTRHSQVTAKRGLAAVWVLEILAFFIHYTMFNLRVWQAAKAGELPLNTWSEDVYIIQAIAPVLAILFSGAAIYAVSTTLALTVEKVEAENFERRNDGILY